MLIVCPGCSKANDLNLPAAANCGHCKAALSGHTYGRVKKTFGAVVLAFGVGVFGTKKVIEHTSVTDRYSVSREFTLISACLNGAQNPLSSSVYRNKAEDCICALTTVQASPLVKEKPEQFQAAFATAARNCKNARLRY